MSTKLKSTSQAVTDISKLTIQRLFRKHSEKTWEATNARNIQEHD